ARLRYVQTELRRVSLCIKCAEPRLVIHEFDMILLSNYLRAGFLPQRDSAGVIAVTVSENDVLDRRLVIGGQQLVMLASVQRDRSVDDDIAFAGLDHERIAEALNHADGFVDLDDLIAVSKQVRWILGDHPLLGVRSMGRSSRTR